MKYVDDTELIFRELNKRCIRDMVELYRDLNLVYAELKNEGISIDDLNLYLEIHRKITELCNISSNGLNLDVSNSDSVESGNDINDKLLNGSDSERVIELKKILEK